MTTRTIVTSQPDVACDVCERRLLRGEQPDVFIAAGRRRIVCELCAPRAAHEGWMRETDSGSVTLPPMRPRRGRSVFERLRQGGKPPAAPTGSAAAREGDASAPSYDFLEAPAARASDPVPAVPSARSAQTPASEVLEDWLAHDGAVGVAPEEGLPAPPSYLERAVAAFNLSEFPRRVAGVARSLGAPEVSVRSAEHLSSVVRIVVAWELCWYRYEVDLSDGLEEACVIDQGTELSELPREDRLANAAADESGALALTAA
jgi:hypothetical protein